MIPLITLLVVMVVSLVIVRVATVALTLTGVSKPLARFQARSAFTGAGFTTDESERMVEHPVRRRIIMLLMLLGNAGIVSAVSSLILTFLGTKSAAGPTSTVWFRITVLAVSLALLWSVAHSQWIDRQMTKWIEKALRRFSKLEIRDYVGLLHLAGDYAVSELQISPEHWMIGRRLSELGLPEEGLLILGVERRDGDYVGAPRGGTAIQPNDTLVIYGRREALASLNRRPAGQAGNWEHVKAVEQQKQAEKHDAD